MTRSNKMTTLAALLTAAVVAAPGSALAHDTTGSAQVQEHVTRSDQALDRALAAIDEGGSTRKAARLFAASRRQLHVAQREAGALQRSARTAEEHEDAAVAALDVAEELDENVEQIVGALEQAQGRVETRLSRALVADTRGRDKAIAALSAVLDTGLSDEASEGIATAIAELSGGRDAEITAALNALTGDDLSALSQKLVSRAVKANVVGQQRAATVLAELIADETIPSAAKESLQAAHDAVGREQGASAEKLADFADRIPAAHRDFLARVEDRARQAHGGSGDEHAGHGSGDAGADADTGSGDAGPDAGTGDAGADARQRHSTNHAG